ncbi:phosphoglucosamine mutase [Methanomassiliicoccus luminyensis]|uniref:phosphoglucosamine mutase n=1 Tax=Methanomassiliicoccus luminyensis TaxID=1080712 RepID=UPI0006748BF6|nr:phosphoglucosamine mutase [Methanomassiliicoccus luminyensis]
MSLFGSSGIRGEVGQDFTLELAVSIGEAVGSEYPDIVQARDTRTSGDMVSSALVAGATSVGAEVHDAGMVPTPTLAREAASHRCGIMVTASHNPPQYNGVKIWNPDGSAFDSLQMNEVEERILGKKADRKDWRRVGSVQALQGAADRHIDAIVRSIGSASSKVVLDCGNGATTSVSPLALRTLGCGLVTLNANPDGFFPGRTSEPTEEALQDLKDTVLKRKADLGIAHDGDGDRMVAVDDRGRFISGDRLIALFASAMKAQGIVAPMDASMVLDDLVGEVVRCKVGDVYVAEALKKSGLDFGGEPSGTYIFPKETYCPDGVYAGALLARMASEAKISDLLDELPSFPAARHSFKFDSSRKSRIKDGLAAAMQGLDCDRLLTLDGFRAEFPDGWFLVRLSGTEPKVRMTVEARDREELKRLEAVGLNIVEGCLR